MKDIINKLLTSVFDVTHQVGSWGMVTSIILWVFKYGPNILEKWFNTSLKFIDVLERIQQYKAGLKSKITADEQ